MKARGYGLIASLTMGLSLGLLPLVADEAAAQVDIDAEGNCNIAILCTASESEGGDATSRGGSGGDGGFASVHDIANAHADASSSVIIDDITTGDAIAHQVNVDARGATRPVVVLVAGSFPDTGVDVFAPGGNAQSGTTGGNGLSADASGGDGGDATADGGNSRSNSDSITPIIASDFVAILDIIGATG
jgi:hypothetical protein